MGERRKLWQGDDWARVSELFDRLQSCTPSERAHCLTTVAATAPAIAEEVRSLLAAYDDSFIEAPLGTIGVSPATPPTPDFPFWLGPYEVLEKIGEGGMAEVFLARDGRAEAGGALVALKRATVRTENLLALFRYEARVGAMLRHPHVVRSEGLFDDATGPVIVMEYVNGVTLERLLARLRKKGEAIPHAGAIAIARAVAAALAYASRLVDAESGKPLALLHRDVTPKNIMLGGRGEIKLLDFGIARGEGRVTLTRTGAIRGTLGYLAPEAARGERPDPRADLYSLGVVLFEMIAGAPLHPETDFFALVEAARNGGPVAERIAELRLPAPLAAFLARALANAPAHRFRDAAAFAAALATAGGPPADAAALATLLASVFGRVFARREKALAALLQKT